MMTDEYLERVVDLIPAEANRIYNMSVDEARARVLSNDPEQVGEIRGSYALLARDGKTVRMARSLDRPVRYFLAKRQEGPALIVAERIDALYQWLKSEGLQDQFHPSYTRMVPAHYVTEIHLVGCPDPDPVYNRFFDPERNALPEDLDAIGKAYIGALAEEVACWLDHAVPEQEPVGVCFSGGIDSGAVFLVAYHVMRERGMNLSRLKAFTLDFGEAPDLSQAREFLQRLDLSLFLEPVPADPSAIDLQDTVRTIEDYKLLDVECAAMGLALLRGIRQRYPEWRYLLDGDGGDENLKDYPIEENPELTIRSVVNNLMLYQEGWGVGKFKHSQTYSGGLSRSYTRSYAPARRYGFESHSPFTSPGVVRVAEGIPFVPLTGYDVPRLYALKGEVVSRGIRQLTGMEFPVFEKRRFQHGAIALPGLRERLPVTEAECRRAFLDLYGV